MPRSWGRKKLAYLKAISMARLRKRWIKDKVREVGKGRPLNERQVFCIFS